MEHLHNVLRDYDINIDSESNHKITYNFNATNLNNIHEEDQEFDDELNYLNTESEFTEITVNEDSQTQELSEFMPNVNVNVYTQHSSRQHSTQSSDSDNMSYNVTFTTDNASDITKAIKKIGKYSWFGCAGHHLNLIAQAGFKQVQSAASLVKKCKKKKC